jgi:hypothetical protein
VQCQFESWQWFLWWLIWWLWDTCLQRWNRHDWWYDHMLLPWLLLDVFCGLGLYHTSCSLCLVWHVLRRLFLRLDRWRLERWRIRRTCRWLGRRKGWTIVFHELYLRRGRYLLVVIGLLTWLHLHDLFPMAFSCWWGRNLLGWLHACQSRGWRIGLFINSYVDWMLCLYFLVIFI